MKKLSKKLSLNKETISILENNEMSKVMGGGTVKKTCDRTKRNGCIQCCVQNPY